MRSVYCLRQTCVRILSHGKVNIFNLAKNAGFFSLLQIDFREP
jgi:hypothetical protein